MKTIIKNAILLPFNILYKFNPEIDLRVLFFLKQGYALNLEQPRTYNEKLQWIKLNCKDDTMPQCVDKYTVREFVKKMECGETLNELIWEGFDPENIPFDELPEKYVIKVTHGSTFNIICKDASNLNRKKTIKKLKTWLNAKFLPCYGEWFYGIEKPRVIVEKYIESDDNLPLKDFKIFCFNGKPHFIRVDTNRFNKNHAKDLYDVNWNRIEGIQMGYKNAEEEIKRPECLELMLEYAAKLSEPFLHARVDFYVVNNKVIFGEITFTNGAGFDKISPHSFDLEMGNCLKLPFE